MTRRSTEGRALKAAKYREAARILEDGKATGCCWALAFAYTDGEWNCRPLTEQQGQDLAQQLRDVYVPDRPFCAMWLRGIDDGHYDQRGRILALCFMAAMVEAGDA